MDYISFRKQFIEQKIVGIHQILAWDSSFTRGNLTNWIRRGLLLRLRQGYYSFPECLAEPEFAYYVANRIYNPSYISTYTALAQYELIPEAVFSITSVSAMKTARFSSGAGTYTYQKIKPELFFGFGSYTCANGYHALMASPEKALLDLFHLSHDLSTAHDIEELRLDEDYMSSEFDFRLFHEYAECFPGAGIRRLAQMTEGIYHD